MNYPVLPVSCDKQGGFKSVSGRFVFSSTRKALAIAVAVCFVFIFFCNFNCHGFKVFFTRLLLLKWEIFELQAISIKKCIEGFPNIFRKQDREKRQIILCNTLRAFISSTVLSVVVMLQSGAPAGVAVRVLWFSAGTCVGERQDGPLLLPLGNLLLLQRNSQCCEVRS